MSKFVEKPDVTGDLRSRMSFTPDISDLKKDYDELVPIMVYGSLKKGGALHSALDGCPTLGAARSATTGFKMLQCSHFPVVFRGASTKSKWLVSELYPFAGEVYLVPFNTLFELDRIEGNGSMYQRSKVWVNLQDDEQGYFSGGRIYKPSMEVFVYFGVMDYWNGGEHLEEVDCLKQKEGSYLKYYDWNPYTPTINVKSPWSEDEVPDFLRGRVG